MTNIFDKKALEASLEKSKLNDHKATMLYFNGEPNISDATKAILEFKSVTAGKYIEIIELQTQMIEKLQIAYDRMERALNVEKHKNYGSFNMN